MTGIWSEFKFCYYTNLLYSVSFSVTSTLTKVKFVPGDAWLGFYGDVGEMKWKVFAVHCSIIFFQIGFTIYYHCILLLLLLMLFPHFFFYFGGCFFCFSFGGAILFMNEVLMGCYKYRSLKLYYKNIILKLSKTSGGIQHNII